MHAHPTESRDACFDVPAISPTNFARGGVDVFKVNSGDPAWVRRESARRAGFVGWLGMGGAVMQWHPELRVGFAFTTDLLAWHDARNSSAARLQEQVARCARRKEGEGE